MPAALCIALLVASWPADHRGPVGSIAFAATIGPPHLDVSMHEEPGGIVAVEVECSHCDPYAHNMTRHVVADGHWLRPVVVVEADGRSLMRYELAPLPGVMLAGMQ
jgi:hypothetical protein